MKLEINRCGCGNTNGGEYVFYTRDYNFKAINSKCSVIRCLKCGSLYPDRFPTLKSIQEVYSNYYTTPMKPLRLRKLVRKFIDLTRLQYAMRGTPECARRILDYGCGSGEFLSVIKDKGISAELYGTDLFEPSQGIGLQKDFEWLTLDDIEDKHYDWITMNHVIEHLTSVLHVLEKLANTLTVGGSIWISTPNADSFLIKHFKTFARDIDFPRHRQIFSRKAVEGLMKKVGFSVQFIHTPRINTVFNFNSCARNVWNCSEMTVLAKICLVMKAGIHTCLHLLLPKRLRDREEPELIMICSLR